MYAHCIFCKRELGTNVVLEQFPVGRKLAFDEAGGRLWVICPHCERWNLSPLEERWEAIERCEREYRLSARRIETDHIGLGVHQSGLSLVRIGAPGRSELAAWRYGDQLLNRRKLHRRSHIWMGAAIMIGWPAILATVAYRSHHKRKPLVVTTGVDGEPVRLSGAHAKYMRILPAAGSWQLEVGPLDRPVVVARDAEALSIAGQLFPWVNPSGSTTDGVEQAVRRLERAGSADALFHAAAAHMDERQGKGRGLVRHVSDGLRLALEMAAHEDLELQAAQGELRRLEEAWQEAEEIARISDSLLIPESVRQMFDGLRASVRRSSPQ